jgi:hypothetical protein
MASLKLRSFSVKTFRSIKENHFMFRVKTLMIFALVASLLLFSSLLTAGLADGGANHRVRNLNFGVSGGNVLDRSSSFCCSGTLGALITDGSNQYILSNNHVLGRSGAAVAGEDVSQPGMIDANCAVTTIVADYTGAAPLGPSNVDAAVAQLRSGQMNSTGSIQDIGVPSSTIQNASVGLSVAKSGRTTGFTTGSVSSINTSVSVQYQQGCGKGKKFTVTYTGQIVITPGNFSAGGDSGSLIVTNNGSHNPVGLLFAGSSSSTIANPIGQVLQRLGSALGRTFSFGGGGGAASTTSDAIQGGGGRRPFIPGLQNLMPQLPEQAAERASAILENHRANLMFQPGVIGVGVGASGRNDGEAAFVVYVNKDAGQKPILPDSIEGIPVTVVLTDEFIAR